MGEFSIDRGVCERLIDLHRDADAQVRRGRMGAGVDTDKKDSYDLIVHSLTPEMVRDYGVARYYAELWGCLRLYLEQHPILKEQVGKFDLTESPVIQHYLPGGGFKMPHFERSNFATSTRMLVWMTYLNDVTDGGGTHFLYQRHTFEARQGRTLIWPSDFTHTHVGVVSPSQHKYIITGWLNYVFDAGHTGITSEHAAL